MKKVLIIEDDKVLSEMYAIKLRKAWFDVRESWNWLEALIIIWEFEPDAILLDLMMPAMNGFETLEAIKNQTSSNAKIIVFTNIVDRDKIDEAMERWADEYLIKANVNPSDVIDTIQKHLELEPKEKPEPIEIKPWLNIFKMKNPVSWEDIEISINIKI